ncbi:MAG TPA: right-handed parallel beta-helix repeat-containing protein [Thermoanaerobaculia bacterium]
MNRAPSAAALLLLLLFAAPVVAEPRIWFIDNSRPPGDGSRAAPFHSIAAAVAAAGDGDVLYLFRGTEPYRESVTLREGQLLAGEGIDLTPHLTARSIAPPPLPSLPAAPVLESGTGDGVVLASGSSVAGVAIRTTTGRGIVATGVSGQVLLDRVPVATGGGTAVEIDGGDAAVLFDASPIETASGTAIAIRNRTGGAVELRNGSAVTVKAGKSAAVALSKNRGRYSFADPLHLTTSGACALCVEATEEVRITSGDSTVSTVQAAALELSGSSVDIYFRHVAVDGATADVARGISLEDVTGTFRIGGGTVRNVGARGISIVRSSGVTLQDVTLEKTGGRSTSSPSCGSLGEEKELRCDAAIYLEEASGITLKDVQVNGGGHPAIAGDRVTDLTIDGARITGAGNETGEHGIQLRELHGRSVIFNSTIKDSAARQLFVANRAGEGTLEIRKSRFDGGPPPHGGQGILLRIGGEAKLSVAIDDSDFIEHFSDGIQAIAEGKARLTLVVNASRFDRVNSAVNLAADRDGRLDYRVTANGITGAGASAIHVGATLTGGTAIGTISGNTIGRSGVAGSGARCGGCSGITVNAARAGSSEVTISGNTIQQVDGFGIRVQGTAAAQLRASIRGNTIRQPHGADVLQAINVQAGGRPADTAKLCVDLQENKISGAWDPPGGMAISLTNKGSAAIAVAGYKGDGADAAAVARLLAARNNGATARSSGAVAAAGSCY